MIKIIKKNFYPEWYALNVLSIKLYKDYDEQIWLEGSSADWTVKKSQFTSKTPNILAPYFLGLMGQRYLSVQKILLCLFERGFLQKLVLTVLAGFQTPLVVATYEHEYRWLNSVQSTLTRY